MHIVVLPSWYKSDENPYMGSFFEEQARALLNAGHKVSIFFPSFYPLSTIFKDKPDYNGTYNDNGLPTYTYIIQGIMPRSQKFNNNHIRWKAFQFFNKYVRENGLPDVLHAHSIFDAGIVGEFLSQKFNIPLVITEHLTHFTGSLKNDTYKKNLAKNIYIGAAKSIAVSRQFKIDLERELDLNTSVFTVVYNMVANHFYSEFQPKKYTLGEEFVFLTNSFLNERKNHTLIFDAIKILIKKNYNVKLMIGGDGERLQFLKDYVMNNRLEKEIVFLGALSRNKVKEEINKSHAFLLGSKYESFGVVLIESIISGRPVISTNCGGPVEIINDENGYLVNSFEPRDFADVMEKMINNYHSFDQSKMRDYCFKRFSEKTISGQLIEIYKEAISQKQSKRNNIKFWDQINIKAATIASWLFLFE